MPKRDRHGTCGRGKRDDLRPHRRGGYAALNAFQLIPLPGATSL